MFVYLYFYVLKIQCQFIDIQSDENAPELTDRLVLPVFTGPLRDNTDLKEIRLASGLDRTPRVLGYELSQYQNVELWFQKPTPPILIPIFIPQ